MNNELKNTVGAADAKAQYDECAKRLLGLKSKQTTVIVDVEAQKKDPSEYKILNRAVFYVGDCFHPKRNGILPVPTMMQSKVCIPSGYV